MRRKGVTVPIETVSMLVKMLVIFAVFLMLARAGSGTLGEVMDSAVGYFKDLLSMCSTDLGTVSYTDFLKTMDQVFDNCKYNDKECGKRTCLTLDLTSEGVPCYQIHRDVLWVNDMREFCETICSYIPKTFQLFCNGATTAGSNTITTGPGGIAEDCLLYEGLSGDAYCKLDDPIFLLGCRGKYFSVGDGADIKISAKKRGILLINTDLTVKVKGGTGYGPGCVPAPGVPPACTKATEAADCTKTTWGWCDVDNGNICRYDHFCVHRTADPRCTKLITTCSFSDGCVPAANVPCPALAGVHSDLVGLINPGTPTLRIDYSETSLLERLMSGSEKCFGFNAVFNTYGAYASCDNPLAKVSMAVVLEAVAADPNKYKVTYYQGCY